MTNLKFYWNGIKENGGKLQKADICAGDYFNFPKGTITIYARDYERFSQGVRDVFRVENDSDMMTDYFEEDKIRVTPNHPLYADVKAALDKREQHYAALHAKRYA